MTDDQQKQALAAAEAGVTQVAAVFGKTLPAATVTAIAGVVVGVCTISDGWNAAKQAGVEAAAAVAAKTDTEVAKDLGQ